MIMTYDDINSFTSHAWTMAITGASNISVMIEHLMMDNGSQFLYIQMVGHRTSS
jgi:hypothetical protein